jgi:16S rRNA (guanine(966)-N(2))-methyltransferase RsmD
MVRSRPSPSRAAPVPSGPGRAVGEVRLIGGVWKRSKLRVPDRPGLRPTPDRVRETLFNWLGQDLRGWCVLDAFAGSGALGFEAASRGATAVRLIESDAGLVRELLAARERLGAEQVEVVNADALAWLARPAVSGAPFDLILLDPPYGADLFVTALQRALPHLAAEGWIYLEADRPFGPAELEPLGLRLHRSDRAGLVHPHLLRRLAAQ